MLPSGRGRAIARLAPEHPESKTTQPFQVVLAGEVYGIPAPQVVGSSIVTGFQTKDGEAMLVRQPKLDFVDDEAGKRVGIHAHIGLRPILAFGNSDGDMQMVPYTTGHDGRRLGLVVYRTDAKVATDSSGSRSHSGRSRDRTCRPRPDP